MPLIIFEFLIFILFEIIETERLRSFLKQIISYFEIEIENVLVNRKWVQTINHFSREGSVGDFLFYESFGTNRSLQLSSGS